MKFKFCMIMLFLSYELQGSDSNQDMLLERESNVNLQLSRAQRDADLVLREDALVCLITLTECLSRLGKPINRPEFRKICDTLETIVLSGIQSWPEVGVEIDNTHEAHKRHAPFFLGLVSEKQIKIEANKLKIPVAKTVEEYKNWIENKFRVVSSATNASAPFVVARAVSAGSNNYGHKE